MASIEDIKFHYAMMQNALLIMRSGVGDIKQAQADYAAAKNWLSQFDAIGELLKIIDEVSQQYVEVSAMVSALESERNELLEKETK